jgi:hypothetical protein
MKRTCSSNPLRSLIGLTAGLLLMTALNSAPANAQAVLSPNKLLFNCVGGQCTPKSTTLTNVGSTSITLSSIEISAGFSLTNDCRVTLKPGGSCVFTLTLSPGASGTLNGELMVNDSAPNSPQVCLLKAIVERSSL